MVSALAFTAIVTPVEVAFMAHEGAHRTPHLSHTRSRAVGPPTGARPSITPRWDPGAGEHLTPLWQLNDAVLLMNDQVWLSGRGGDSARNRRRRLHHCD